MSAYDAIADWYEQEFPARDDDPIGIDAALRTLLGQGTGTCLEIGCGTGVHAACVRDLGWTPVGIDIAAGMLRHAAARLPVARADATRLPFADATMDAAISVMVHTDMPAYPAVLHEATRVLHPGGRFVHIGVHPCFCGAFADRTDPEAIIVGPGYRTHHTTTDSWTANGLRDKVGATHWPLPDLLTAFHAAGLTPMAYAEGGVPTPTVFAVGAVRAGGFEGVLPWAIE